ncbi:MAG: hypothetical protein ABEJ86_00750 [Halococcoides sp.]
MEIWLGSETGLTTPLAIREKFTESEFLGWWAVLNGFIVNAYYVVILGWSAAFIVFAITNGFDLATGNFFTPGISSPTSRPSSRRGTPSLVWSRSGP